MRCCGGRAVAFFIDAPPSDPLLHQRCGDGAGDNLFLLRTAARRRGQQAASSDRLQTKYSPVRHVLTRVGEQAGKGNMPALGWSEATPCEFQGLDVHPRFGVGTVWRESVPAAAGVVSRFWVRRSAGAWPSRTVESVRWGGCEGRHKAGSCGDLMGQAGRGLAGHVRIGTCYEYRHPVDEAWPGLGGALRGRSPRTREGRIGPTAQNCSG